MKVAQFEYLSPEACELRRRDGTPPWEPHVCELDATSHHADDANAFGQAWRRAHQLRLEIEEETNDLDHA